MLNLSEYFLNLRVTINLGNTKHIQKVNKISSTKDK